MTESSELSERDCVRQPYQDNGNGLHSETCMWEPIFRKRRRTANLDLYCKSSCKVAFMKQGWNIWRSIIEFRAMLMHVMRDPCLSTNATRQFWDLRRKSVRVEFLIPIRLTNWQPCCHRTAPNTAEKLVGHNVLQPRNYFHVSTTSPPSLFLETRLSFPNLWPVWSEWK